MPAPIRSVTTTTTTTTTRTAMATATSTSTATATETTTCLSDTSNDVFLAAKHDDDEDNEFPALVGSTKADLLTPENQDQEDPILAMAMALNATTKTSADLLLKSLASSPTARTTRLRKSVTTIGVHSSNGLLDHDSARGNSQVPTCSSSCSCGSEFSSESSSPLSSSSSCACACDSTSTMTLESSSPAPPKEQVLDYRLAVKRLSKSQSLDSLGAFAMEQSVAVGPQVAPPTTRVEPQSRTTTPATLNVVANAIAIAAPTTAGVTSRRFSSCSSSSSASASSSSWSSSSSCSSSSSSSSRIEAVVTPIDMEPPNDLDIRNATSLMRVVHAIARGPSQEEIDRKQAVIYELQQLLNMWLNLCFKIRQQPALPPSSSSTAANTPVQTKSPTDSTPPKASSVSQVPIASPPPPPDNQSSVAGSFEAPTLANKFSSSSTSTSTTSTTTTLEADTNALQADTQPPTSSRLSCSLFLGGSWHLRVGSSECDLDLVALFPKFVTLHDFFGPLCSFLRKSKLPPISKLVTMQTAAVPIVCLVVRDVRVDLLFARLPTNFVPRNLPIYCDQIFCGMDQLSIKALSIPRVASLILQLVPNVPTFRGVLRVVRVWAKMRGLYSNKMGFLGGISWSILVAFVCQMVPMGNVAQIVQRFFHVLSHWHWPMPVLLCKPYENDSIATYQWNPQKNLSDRKHVMPILTPGFPSTNSCVNVCESTSRILQQEFERANSICDQVPKTCHATVVYQLYQKLFTPSEFLVRYDWYVQVELLAANHDQLMEWAAFVASRIRKLVEILSHTPTICNLHPFPQLFVDSKLKEKDKSGSKRAHGFYFIGFERRKEDVTLIPLPAGRPVQGHQQVKLRQAPPAPPPLPPLSTPGSVRSAKSTSPNRTPSPTPPPMAKPLAPPTSMNPPLPLAPAAAAAAAAPSPPSPGPPSPLSSSFHGPRHANLDVLTSAMRYFAATELENCCERKNDDMKAVVKAVNWNQLPSCCFPGKQQAAGSRAQFILQKAHELNVGNSVRTVNSTTNSHRGYGHAKAVASTSRSHGNLRDSIKSMVQGNQGLLNTGAMAALGMNMGMVMGIGMTLNSSVPYPAKLSGARGTKSTATIGNGKAAMVDATVPMPRQVPMGMPKPPPPAPLPRFKSLAIPNVTI